MPWVTEPYWLSPLGGRVRPGCCAPAGTAAVPASSAAVRRKADLRAMIPPNRCGFRLLRRKVEKVRRSKGLLQVGDNRDQQGGHTGPPLRTRPLPLLRLHFQLRPDLGRRQHTGQQQHLARLRDGYVERLDPADQALLETLGLLPESIVVGRRRRRFGRPLPPADPRPAASAFVEHGSLGGDGDDVLDGGAAAGPEVLGLLPSLVAADV